MKSIRRWRKSGNSLSMFILLAIVIVIGISVIILVKSVPSSSDITILLEEGKDYDINHNKKGIYTIVDDTGNIIELERISSEVFEDRQGNRYKFVSGSPFKYMGEYEE